MKLLGCLLVVRRQFIHRLFHVNTLESQVLHVNDGFGM